MQPAATGLASARRRVPVHAALFCLVALATNGESSAQQRPEATVDITDALTRCRSESVEPDVIHACLDERLGALDERMEGLGREVLGRVDADAADGFRRSQRAFANFRRENCLWYLEIASPPDEADQVAKNCLVDTTLERLDELERLLFEARAPEAIVTRGTATAPPGDVSVAVDENDSAVGGDPPRSTAGQGAGEDEALLAYFGDWRADCRRGNGTARCRLGVAVTDPAPALVATAADGSGAQLGLERRADGIVAIEIDLPGLSPEQPGDLRWRVDGRDLGTLSGVRLVDGRDPARQRIDDPDTIAAILPSLRDGVELVVDSTGDAAGARGGEVAATLMGLTRALAFADDFVSGGAP